ncbi:MAG: TIGR01212 family radical SAM protein [Deltaproteobacteria bacterium]|nr:TIGR01212 family radical SAM protein [Candidatus Tharpella sp.]
MNSEKLRHPLWVTGKPYYDLKSYYRNHFGERVYKVQIDAGFTCPNRDGSRGLGGCSYCDGRGSQLRQQGPLPSVRAQLEEGKKLYKRLRKATRFVAYFQTCTNTYGELARLRELYEEALSVDEIVGLAVGTRPDSITPEVVDLLAGFSSDYDVWLEYGLQSMHNESLARINRGHSLEEFEQAVEMLSGSGIKLCVHVIIGLPWEDREMVFQTADFVARLPVDGIKIHSLLLLKGTQLYADFLAQPFSLLSRAEYVSRVAGFLERLPPEVVVQRLTAEGYRDIFVAPDWARNKLQVLQHLDRYQNEHGSYQGKIRLK